MARGVVYKPDEVWEYFIDNCEDMVIQGEEHMIAESDEYKIYLCSSDDCTTGIIHVYDTPDEDMVAEDIFGETECEAIITKSYKEFGVYKDGVKSLFEEHKDEIIDSEDNLTDAVTYFIHEAVSATVPTCRLSTMKNDLGITDEEIEETKNHFLEYLYVKLGIDLYRPMIVQFDDGEKFFEHPYSHLELDENKYN